MTQPPYQEQQSETGSTAEFEDRPQSRREWRGALRGIVVPLMVVAAIVGSIWLLENDGDLPFLAGSNGGPGPIPDDATYVSLESQGIKLGAKDGPAPKIGEPAPDFALTDLDGNLVRLSDLRGKTVLLNAWATWCTPCKREFPELVGLYEANKDRGLVVIGLNLREAPPVVRKFAEEFGAKFPIVIDKDGSVISRYRLLGLPSTWFVDANGILRAQHIGLLTEEVLLAKLSDSGFTVAGYP